jgi:hypothetical protein
MNYESVVRLAHQVAFIWDADDDLAEKVWSTADDMREEEAEAATVLSDAIRTGKGRILIRPDDLSAIEQYRHLAGMVGARFLNGPSDGLVLCQIIMRADA